MAGSTASRSKADRLEDSGISESEMKLQSSTVLVARLVARGVSRLTAERFVEIKQGAADPGRARRHAVARH
jgi:hypothetical protein